ncbi:hypothetical protein AXG93_2255s1110 [Marchantia polymorpha subsp. ruderalis]|uniref:Uncharacterized protein n=1 Tax=Marchantia polymorpha subsp. ruderalis TaxID=1480154 RepID=A0A176W7C6_MARPO|nr:hypothetical protein AXG93_2255s1110 [Marchantia polymorpha subsp. ruderalis]
MYLIANTTGSSNIGTVLFSWGLGCLSECCAAADGSLEFEHALARQATRVASQRASEPVRGDGSANERIWIPGEGVRVCTWSWTIIAPFGPLESPTETETKGHDSMMCEQQWTFKPA